MHLGEKSGQYSCQLSTQYQKERDQEMGCCQSYSVFTVEELQTYQVKDVKILFYARQNSQIVLN